MFRRGGSAPRRTPLTIVTSVPVVDFWDARYNISVATGVNLWVGAKGTQALQGSGPSQPLYTSIDANFGGLPSITFDGVNDSLVSSLNMPAPGVTPAYYWYVFRLVTWTLSGALTTFSSGTVTAVAYCSAVTPDMRPFCITPGNPNGNTSIGSARRGATYFSGSAADSLQIGNVTVTGAMGSGASNGFSFGGAPSNLCNYSLFCMGIWLGKPTAQEQSALDAWAISQGLPTGILI